MWRIINEPDLSQFRELPMPSDSPVKMPAKRVIVWVDKWGFGIEKPKLYLLDSQEPEALSQLQQLWHACYRQGAIMNLKLYDAGNIEIAYVIEPNS